MKKVTKQYSIIILTLILEFILNIMVQLLPDSFKKIISQFSSYLGISYNLFWLIITIIILIIVVIISLKDLNSKGDKEERVTRNSSKRVINQYGDKSIYIENNNGDIDLK